MKQLPLSKSNEDYLNLRTEKTDGCWKWKGSSDNNGYSRCYRYGGQSTVVWERGDLRRETYAHRLAYKVWVGEIPQNFVVHHKCENHQCVNPEHLEAISKDEHDYIHIRSRIYYTNKIKKLNKKIHELEETIRRNNYGCDE